MTLDLLNLDGQWAPLSPSGHCELPRPALLTPLRLALAADRHYIGFPDAAFAPPVLLPKEIEGAAMWGTPGSNGTRRFHTAPRDM